MSGDLHKRLVEIAARWLERTRRCALVATELVTYAPETPDAIGWQQGRSILVECKASRADFRRDWLKAARGYGGLGTERYYLAPAGVIKPTDLEDGNIYLGGNFWGLLEVDADGRVRQRRASDPFKANLQGEIHLLLSIIRRQGVPSLPGLSCRFYTIENKATANVGIAEEKPN